MRDTRTGGEIQRSSVGRNRPDRCGERTAGARGGVISELILYAEERVRRLQSFDCQDLGSASPEPARDLLIVAGAPADEAGSSIDDAARHPVLLTGTRVRALSLAGQDPIPPRLGASQDHPAELPPSSDSDDIW